MIFSSFVKVFILAFAVAPFAHATKAGLRDSICKTALSLATDTSGYEYEEYKGSKNAVLENLLATPVEFRNPRVANVCKHGKVFPWQIVYDEVFGHFRYEGQPYDEKYSSNEMHHDFTFADPLNYAQREGLSQWIVDQYPKLTADMKELRDAIPTGVMTSAKIERWLQAHPLYVHGLLLFPQPTTIWNRVARQYETLLQLNKFNESLRGAIDAGKKHYYIEIIAALFNPILAESHFNDLNAMLIDLAGPQVSQLSKEVTIRTIARWVLTQYPELQSIAAQSEPALDKDFLTQRFGRKLAVVPIQWATGQMSQVMPLIPNLEPLPSIWESETLPRLMAYIRGDTQPNVAYKRFELKDPISSVRRALKSGDEVELSFIPSNQKVRGLVHAVIVDNGEVVGMELKLREIEKTGFLKKPLVYWLSDFDVEGSSIQNTVHQNEIKIELSKIDFPEDSGQVTIHYGIHARDKNREMQVPISIGDYISFSLQKKPGEDRGQYLNMVVTNFEKDAQGQMIGLRGYTDGSRRYPDKETILQENQGKAEKVLLLSDIQRTSASFGSGESAYKYYTLPQSFKREPYDHLETWVKSNTSGSQIREDSGDFMLRIGEPLFPWEAPEGEQAPLTLGDEVMLLSLRPSSRLGWVSDRVLISEFVRQHGKVVGVRGESDSNRGDSRGTWFFKDIVVEQSCLVTRPYFGRRANAIPGAFDKRVPYNGGVSRSRFSIPQDVQRAFEPWQNKPISFEEWLAAYGIAYCPEAQVHWAYWVLQASPPSTAAEIKKKYRQLVFSLHPDRGGSVQCMTFLNMANDILLKHGGWHH